MEKRQALLGVLILVLLAAGGFWWFTQQAAAPVEEEVTVAPPKPAAPAAPAKPVESDVVALKEEELDKIKAETDDLAARAVDLEEQVKDGEMLIELKAKQIQKLEAELKKLKSGSPNESKKK